MLASWHLRAALLSIALVCSACDATVGTGRHDGGPVTDGATRTDGDPIDAAPTDGGPTTDAPSGIACGTATCNDTEVCCTADFGRTGTCQAFPPGCSSATDARFICDGPEDCVPSAECCFQDGGSACLPDGSCARGRGQVLCHDDGDCGEEPCCPAAAGSPYAMCFSACPT